MPRSAILSLVAAGLLAVLLSGRGGADGGPRVVTGRPAGTIVFVSDGNRLASIDVASGRRAVRRIRSLPACGAQLFVTGGHVVFSGVVRGRTTVFSVPISLDRRPTRLGTAHAYVPSATDGRVWLAGTDCDRRVMVGVREVAVDGRVTFESSRRVPASWVVDAVSGGLVVHHRGGLSVWDPGTGRLGRRLGLEMGFGAHGSLLAGCVARSDCDDLAIVDTATGGTVPVRRQLEVDAAFSPDGSLLATAARVGRRWSVALVDTRTGTATIVQGSRTRRAYPEVAWAPTSGWLFIRDGRRIRAFQPGAPAAETLRFRLPPSAAAFAAT